MNAQRAGSAPSGLVVVDKPAGWTSHDVVGRLRRLVGTRRVGHAGTLDPTATGVLVIGVGSATRLLHHLQMADKAYTATVRLGVATTTDDADGEIVAQRSAATIGQSDVVTAMADFQGTIRQVPSAVSAIKVDGRRAYAEVRAGRTVTLAAREVTVSRFAAVGWRRVGDAIDIDVEVECSSGTYVRALARDLGAALGVGGHLTALRRTRVGPFTLADARSLDELAAASDPVPLDLAAAVRATLPVRDVDAGEARELAYGRTLAPMGRTDTYAAIGPDGVVVALLIEADGRARPVLVFTPAG